MGSGPSMEDHLFNLRFTAKSLAREAKKSEANAGANKLKCKKAMEQANMDGARIFAESAIRDKNTALNYLRLSSRIDAVAQRVNTAVKMQTLTKDMSGIVKSMESVMKTMNVEKITKVMDQFEQQFENLDLSTGVMESSMQSSTAQAMPESQVEGLMQEVADEHGLEFEGGLNQLGSGQGRLTQKGQVEAHKQQQQQQQQQQQEKPSVLLAGGPAAAAGTPAPGSKDGKDDDDSKQGPPPSGSGGGGSGGGGGGGMAASSSSSSSSGGHAAADDENSLEERLRRLQQ